MNLSSFIERFAQYDIVRDKEAIIADLEALAGDRGLLGQHLLACIRTDGFDSDTSIYNAYAFTLYECERYMIRLVIWAPVDSQEEAYTFIYGLVHNHDFDLFVTGYFGDGYESVIHPISSSDVLVAGVKPTLGEPVSIKVAPGESYFMAALRDIHVQWPPTSLSASLSLVVYRPELAPGDRSWCFDEDYVPQHAGIGGEELQLYEAGMEILELMTVGAPTA